MTVSSTLLKILAALVAAFTTGGSIIWYASAKSTTIDQQERHLEANDTRIDLLEVRIRLIENRLVHVEDATHGH